MHEYVKTSVEYPPYAADPEGGPPPPLKNHKNIGVLSNSGLDPMKNYKATKPIFNVGVSQAAR